MFLEKKLHYDSVPKSPISDPFGLNHNRLNETLEEKSPRGFSSAQNA